MFLSWLLGFLLRNKQIESMDAYVIRGSWRSPPGLSARRLPCFSSLEH